jgi:hypothetical protein
MTLNHLLMLDQLAVQDDSPLTEGERKAVRAILVERERALEHISELASLVEMGPDYTPGTDAYTAGEVAKLFHRAANGG